MGRWSGPIGASTCSDEAGDARFRLKSCQKVPPAVSSRGTGGTTGVGRTGERERIFLPYPAGTGVF
jgi:hypothetical protein